VGSIPKPPPFGTPTRLEELPTFDGSGLSDDLPQVPEQPENQQDEAQWKKEAAKIAATRRRITWRSPSRHESFPNQEPAPLEEELYTDTASLGETFPDLKANDAYLRLLEELKKAQEAVKGSRESYLKKVEVYNDEIRRLPYALVAHGMEYTKIEPKLQL
jgi:hypothetical protein